MNLSKAFLAGVLTTALILLGTPAPTRAEMVGTAQLLAPDTRNADEAPAHAFLAREDVRKQLKAWGVDPQAADARVAALTDSELQQLNQTLQQAPAAGDAGIFVLLGVIFLVLIILDLTGIIHIFRH